MVKEILIYCDNINETYLSYVIKNLQLDGQKIGIMSCQPMQKTINMHNKLGMNSGIIAENGACFCLNPVDNEIYSEYENYENFLHYKNPLTFAQIENAKLKLKKLGLEDYLSFEDREASVGFSFKRFPYELFDDNGLCNFIKRNIYELKIDFGLTVALYNPNTSFIETINEYVKLKSLKLEEIAVISHKDDEMLFYNLLNSGAMLFYLGNNNNVKNVVRKYPTGYTNNSVNSYTDVLIKLDFFKFFSSYRKNIREEY
ncbi:hypothetical protein D6777_02915 [Candidatus Woesearchaeota archaeon]|nr:MAG: hypothetical protein D6777_02915 [Candidatus Woesearchaeota archaeon]